jgi:hypothetical protein
VVVVAPLTAHVDHRVDGRAAAEHLAPCVVESAPVQPGLGFRLEAPVRARIVDREEIADGDLDPEVVVLAAGLEQEHRTVRIGREAVGEDAPGAASADDDVVERT